jgi:hypothetical protein
VRFLLDNDVDHDVANLLRGACHSVVTASEVGLQVLWPPPTMRSRCMRQIVA